jgi:hypothetical protein
MLPISGTKGIWGKALRISFSMWKRGGGGVEGDDGGGVEAGDLAAELRADGAGGAGDEDGGAGDSGANDVEIEVDGGAAEEVVHGDIADLAGEVVFLDELGHAGYGFAAESGIGGAAERFRHLRSGGGGDGEEEVGCAGAFGGAGEIAAGAGWGRGG